MSEVTPVVFDFKARVDGYLSTVRSATRTVDQQLGIQEKRIRSLEAEMRRSTGQIGNSLKGLSTSLAAYFSGRELVGLIDSFTRLQNQLKVAGLEGGNLAAVQERLYALGAKYGVSVNALSELYGKASQAGKELGATQDQLLALTEATSQSLLITGTSTEQASGAILGLSQALASGTVRAEEFNQINEGGLRPLLEAAAASDRFGGSVAKLRAAVLAGKVSSQELYQAILANAALLDGKASKATLTLSGAFQSLRDQLAKYAGEAGQSSGATALVADAIQGLADNVDVLIPALAVLATALGIQTVASAAAGSRALFALSAVMGGAATASEGLAFAMNGLKGALPLAVITALVAGVGILVSRFQEESVAAENARAAVEAQAQALGTSGQAALNAAAASNTLNAQQNETIRGVAALTGEVDKLTTAWGRVAAAAKQAALEQARATLDAANSNLIKVRMTSKVRNEAFNQVAQRPFVERGMGTQVLPTNSREALAAADRAAKADPKQAELERLAQANVDAAKSSLAEIQSRRLATFQPSVAAPAAGKPTEGSGSRGASGPSAEDIAKRFNDQLAQYAQQTWSAWQQTAKSADERAEFELRGVELSRSRALAEIDADKAFSGPQKKRLKAALETAVQAERESIEHGRLAEIERDAADLAEERFRGEQDGLRLQLDLADTQADRRDIALRILDAEDAYLKSRLEAVIASQTETDAAKERARVALAALTSQSAARRAGVERDFEGPLARYARDTRDTETRVEEAAAQRIRDLNATIADTMAHELGIKDPFLKQLLEIFLDQNLFGPLAAALSRHSSGGSGLLGGILSTVGAVFGVKSGGGLGAGLNKRASGGPVSAGGAYLVGENGPEVLQMGATAGFVIPNHALNKGGAGTTVVQHFHLDARGAVMTQDLVNQINAMGQAAADAGARGGYAASMNEIRTLQRPKL